MYIRSLQNIKFIEFGSKLPLSVEVLTLYFVYFPEKLVQLTTVQIIIVACATTNIKCICSLRTLTHRFHSAIDVGRV